MRCGAVTTTPASSTLPGPTSVPLARLAAACTTVAYRYGGRSSRSAIRFRLPWSRVEPVHSTTAAFGWSATTSSGPSTGSPSMVSPCRAGLSSRKPSGLHCGRWWDRTAASVSLASPPAPTSSSGRDTSAPPVAEQHGGQRLDHGVLLVLGELVVQRQDQTPLGQLLGHRQRYVRVVAVRRLQVRRHDAAAPRDAAPGQRGQHAVARAGVVVRQQHPERLVVRGAVVDRKSV